MLGAKGIRICSVYTQEGALRQENWILVPHLSLTIYKITGLLTVSKALSGSRLCLNTAFDQESRTFSYGAELIELCS